VTALFVAAGAMPTWRWRRQLRAAAIIGFAVALAVVLSKSRCGLPGELPFGNSIGNSILPGR